MLHLVTKELFTCTHAIIGINGSTKREDRGNITFRFELAPIYNSIKMVNKKSNDKIRMTPKNIEEYKKNGISIAGDEIHKMTYSLIKSPVDKRVIEIDGSSEYVNWYKNQGSRLLKIFP